MDENKVIPLLPLRGMLVFPGMIINLDVGRDRSIKAVESAMAVDRKFCWLLSAKPVRLNQMKAVIYLWCYC